MLAGIFRRLSFGLLKTQEALSEADLSRAQRWLIVDGVCSTAMGTLQGGPFLTAFALAIGASNYEIGMLAAIGFMGQPMQLLGLYLVEKFRKRRAITFVCAAAARLCWLFIILIPVLFAGRGMTFMIQWMMIAGLIGSIPSPAWNSLIRDIVPSSRLGRVFSQRMFLATIVALMLNLIGGYFVDWWEVTFPDAQLYAYSLVFLAGLLFALLGAAAIARLPEPQMKVEKQVPMTALLAQPLKDQNYRPLLIFIAAWNFAVNLAAPFFVIYMLKRIGLSLFLVAVLTVTSQLTSILFLRLWGRLADRYSNKSVMGLSGSFFLLSVLAWCFTTMPERYFLTLPILFSIHIFSGIAMAGVSLSSANIALKLAPQGSAHSYMTLFGLAGAITGATAPLVGGLLGDFFSVRELAVSIDWSSPARELAVSALNFRALDFVFLIACFVGFFALNRLATVKEEGEVTEREVRDELVDEVVSSFRSITSIAGVRRMAFFPVRRVVRAVNRAGPEKG